MTLKLRKTFHPTKPRFPYSDENGAALVIGLMFVAILAMLGTAAVVMTTTDLKIGGNYKRSTQALSAAQAGLDEARARLGHSVGNPAGDPASTPDPTWSAYITTSTSFSPSSYDRDYNSSYKNYFPYGTNQANTTPTVNTLQAGTPDIQYLVKIRHKTEFDAEQAGHDASAGTIHYNDNDGDTSTHTAGSPGSIIYYGDDPSTPDDPNWIEFTYSGSISERVAKPIEIVRAYGCSGASLGITEVELRISALGVDTEATLYAKDNVVSNGTVRVDGRDNNNPTAPGGCATNEATKSPIYTYPAGTSTTLNGTSNELHGIGETSLGVSGDAPSVDGDININITDFVDQFKGSETVTITSDQNGTIYGSATDYVACYSDPSDPYNVQGLKLQGVTGYGLLVVDGDLELGGGFNWTGLVICTGTLTFNGGSGPNSIQIEGAILAEQTVTMNGSVDLFYNSCTIKKSLLTTRAKICRWRQVY